MKRKAILMQILILLLLFGLSSCGWKRDPNWRLKGHRPDWIPEDEAIQLLVKADPQLNRFDDLPHTLYVCVYQLKDINALRQYTSNDEMIYDLLGNNCGFKDGVIISRPLTIRPGSENIYSINRAEGTKYIVVIAGYSKLRKEGAVREKEIPVLVKKSLFSARAKPGRLTLEIYFGPESILKFKEG